jgi:hypothetical protein
MFANSFSASTSTIQYWMSAVCFYEKENAHDGHGHEINSYNGKETIMSNYTDIIEQTPTKFSPSWGKGTSIFDDEEDSLEERKTLDEQVAELGNPIPQRVIEPPRVSAGAAEVEDAIDGSPLGQLSTILSRVTVPNLPIEATLPKALVLAGSTLAMPVSYYDPHNEFEECHGIDLAKFKIMTAGGQTTNIWSLMVAETGGYKDIGQMVVRCAKHVKNLVGTSGSQEGLSDAYIERGAGILAISEFEGYIRNGQTWQSQARTWLTSAFNAGYFDVQLSKRSGNSRRKANYCYPSIIANIQPQVIRSNLNRLYLDSGFLPRFLISSFNRINCRPATNDLGSDIEEAHEIMDRYQRLEGNISIPQGYLQELHDELFADERLHGFAARYVNEYGPKIACILQADGADIRDETWSKTATILRWFYGMAGKVINDSYEDERQAKFENDCERFYNFIRKKKTVQKSRISRNFSKGTSAKYREMILKELVDRGWASYSESANSYSPSSDFSPTFH